MSASPSRKTSSSEAIRAFFDQWHLYDLLVRNDYMSHRAIHRALRASLSAQRRSPFSVADLGCGDASVVAKTLRGLPVARYVGIDLSEIALDVARKTFADAAFPCRFTACNLDEYMSRPGTEQTDVVIAGFVVHHLQDDQKKKFFHDCAEKLRPGGDLYLFDVFRQSGQARDAYLDVYCDRLENEWTELSADQKRSVSEHIRAFDFPVDYETMVEFARQAAFRTPAEPYFADESGFHCLCRFSHPNLPRASCRS